ncbi:MAG: PadR family transcriptional regulator [Promethearchaeota archaeon]
METVCDTTQYHKITGMEIGEKKVIKRIKDPDPNSLIGTDSNFRDFIEKFESEINRGISTLCVLSVIKSSGSAGIHGYQIIKELRERTDNILIVEEGTLYPLLRKIEKEGFIESKRVEVDGRLRKNYFASERGLKAFNRMEGFYSKLIEVISPFFDVNIKLEKKFYYCPDCANKIDVERYSENNLHFCSICGHNIEKELIERGLIK